MEITRKIAMVLGCCLAIYAFAVPQKTFRHAPNSQDLSNNNIQCMVQDRDGYLWIGTAYGLNRYDGYHIKQYTDALGEIKGITDLVLDSYGSLWIKTAYNDLQRYEPELDKFVKAEDFLIQRGLSSKETYNVAVDNYGYSWFTAEDSIIRYNPQGHKWQGYALPEAYNLRGVGVVEGDIYIAVHDKILMSEKGEKAFEPIEVNDARLARLLTQSKHVRITTDDNSNLWIYSSEAPWVWRKRRGQSDIEEIKLPDDTFVITALIDDHNGNIWIATNHNGVYVYDKSTEEISNICQPLSANTTDPFYSISQLYIDRNDNIWAGTYASGLYMRQLPKRQIDTRMLGDDVVSVLHPARDGSLWVGTDGNGLWREQGDKRTRIVPEARIITALCEDSQGRLWIGTFSGGLYCYEGGEVRKYTPENSDLPENNIYAISEDGDGNLWLGTLGHGLIRYDGEKFDRVLDDIHSVATIIYDAPSNTVWACGDTGVARIDLGKGTQQMLTRFGDVDISNRFVRHIYKDSTGNLWMALNGEVLRWQIDGTQVDIWRHDDGLPGAMVNAIIEDSNGHIWVTTDNGLAEITILPTGAVIKPYSVNDGLITNYFTSNKAATEYPGGTMLFGAEGGYDVITGAESLPRTSQAAPIISGVWVENAPLLPGHILRQDGITEVRVPYGNGPRSKSLQINFADFDFAGVNKEALFYRLAADDPWIRIEGNQLRLGHITPGRYDISLMKIDANGNSRVYDNLVSLKISEPWWLSTWAILVYILMFCALLVCGLTYYLRRRTRKMQEQLDQVDIKRKAEMDKLKVRFMANISHDLRDPLSLIITPLAELKKESNIDGSDPKLDTAYKNANRLMALINQLLDIRRLDAKDSDLHLEQGDLVEFVNDQIAGFKVFTDNNDRRLTFETTLDKLPLRFDRDKMQRILYNLLSNAFKYTKRNGQIDVTLSMRDGNALLRVVDDGVGISNENKPHIFDRFYQVDAQEGPKTGAGMGLPLVHQYVKQHGGKIWIEDNLPTGCIFVISLPLSGE